MTHEATTPAAQPAGEPMILTCQVKSEFTIEVPIHNGMSKEEANASAIETVRERLKSIGAVPVRSWSAGDPEGAVEQLHLRISGARFETMRRAWFFFDEAEKPEDYFIGWTDGSRWNGWGMPFFEKDVADRVLAWHNQQIIGDQPKAYFKDDRYHFPWIDAVEGEPPHEGYENQEIEVPEAEESVTVYAIGAGSWCWNVSYEDPTNRPAAEPAP